MSNFAQVSPERSGPNPSLYNMSTSASATSPCILNFTVKIKRARLLSSDRSRALTIWNHQLHLESELRQLAWPATVFSSPDLLKAKAPERKRGRHWLFAFFTMIDVPRIHQDQGEINGYRVLNRKKVWLTKSGRQTKFKPTERPGYWLKTTKLSCRSKWISLLTFHITKFEFSLTETLRQAYTCPIQYPIPIVLGCSSCYHGCTRCSGLGTHCIGRG